MNHPLIHDCFLQRIEGFCAFHFHGVSHWNSDQKWSCKHDTLLLCLYHEALYVSQNVFLFGRIITLSSLKPVFPLFQCSFTADRTWRRCLEWRWNHDFLEEILFISKIIIILLNSQSQLCTQDFLLAFFTAHNIAFIRILFAYTNLAHVTKSLQT